MYIQSIYIWPHFEKKDGHYGYFSTFSKEFSWPSRTKDIIVRDVKFAGYVHHYKILTGYIFGLILKSKMAATGISFQSPKVLISPLLLVLEVCNVKPTYRKSWVANLLMWLDSTLGPAFKVKRGNGNLKVVITHLLLVLEVLDGKPTYRKSWAVNLWCSQI